MGRLQKIVLAAALSLVGCAQISPYRADLRQGNFLDRATLEQVKEGMTRDQVRFVLGSPLLVDSFRSDRWDYVYLFRPGHGKVSQRRASVFFDNDLVARVDIEREGFAADADAAAAAAQLQAANRVVEIQPKAEK